MEQSPDELSGNEGQASEEDIDKITGEPMNAPEKQAEADEGPEREQDGG